MHVQRPMKPKCDDTRPADTLDMGLMLVTHVLSYQATLRLGGPLFQHLCGRSGKRLFRRLRLPSEADTFCSHQLP